MHDLLLSLGWSDARERALAAVRHDLDRSTLAGARVAAAHRGSWAVIGPDGETTQARAVGRVFHRAVSPLDLPAVGDWVAVDLEAGQIHAVLPRSGALCRKDPGGGVQVLAANLEVVFIVTACDGDLNPRRVERFAALALDAGAEPVVVLNKADLVGGTPERELALLHAVVPAGTSILPIVATAGSGLDAVEAFLGHGRTAALVGSSGVGKSTLANALLDTDQQATGAVRADDSRGRHTTVRRELLPLAVGGALIDSPGLRAPALWTDGTGLPEVFDDIADLAAQCRFADCRHEQEPGCAIRVALTDGRLAPERLAAHDKLERERIELAEREADVAGRRARKERRRAIHREHRRRGQEQW